MTNNSLEDLFIQSLKKVESIKQFFETNPKNFLNLKKSKSYQTHSSAPFDICYNILEEINKKGGNISEQFTFKYKYTSSKITLEFQNEFLFINFIDKNKTQPITFKDCIETLKSNSPIEIKIGEKPLKNEGIKEFSIVKESKILIIFIENIKRLEIQHKIDLFELKLLDKKVEYCLNSYIYVSKGQINTGTTDKKKTITLPFSSFFILIYVNNSEENEMNDNNNVVNDNNVLPKTIIVEKGEKKPIGLNNCDGSYCYMNSVLQCLFALSNFRNNILNKEYDSNQPISLGLQKVIKGLLDKNNNSYDPTHFKLTLSKNAKLFQKIAGDPSDLILYLLNQLHEEDKIEEDYNDIEVNEENEEEVYKECKASIEKSIISDLFYGYYGEKDYCKSCKKNFYIIEPKFLIELNIEGISKKIKYSITLSEYFNKYYENKEEKYFICPVCHGKKLALVYSYIKELPKILVIVLKKNLNDFKKIIIENELKYNNNTFNLIGTSTIAYRPTYNYYGHAIAYCFHNNQYYLFNDINVDYANFWNFKNKEHYILFYQKKK